MKFRILAAVAIAMFSTAALAADPIEPEMIIEDDPVHDWSGLYVGAFGGYAVGNINSTLPAPPALDVGIAGFLAGVDAGYNVQMDEFLLGVEVDAAWTNASGSSALGAPGCGVGLTCTEQSNWLASLRGRVGFVADAALLYATAGVGVLNHTSNTLPPPGGTTGTYTGTYVGYVVGAGVEVMVAENASVKAEYNFSSYLGQVAPAGTLGVVPVTVTPNAVHAIKVGANWHFD